MTTRAITIDQGPSWGTTIHQRILPWCAVHDTQMYEHTHRLGRFDDCWVSVHDDEDPVTCRLDDPPRHWVDV